MLISPKKEYYLQHVILVTAKRTKLLTNALPPVIGILTMPLKFLGCDARHIPSFPTQWSAVA